MLAVARSLGPWFNDGGLAEMAADFKTHRALVAVDGDGQVTGFVTWAPSPHTPEPGLVELTWLGVLPDRHRAGLGRRLLAALADACRAEGARAIQVSTIADSVEYEPYARTRAFYRAVGFADYRVDPGFYEGDDRLLLRLDL
jgi:GNAT superfamily N-acetyltransferase